MNAVGVIGAGEKAQSLIAKMRNVAKVFSYDPKCPLELKFHQNESFSVFKEPIGYFFPIGEMMKSVDVIFVCLSSKVQQELVLEQIRECVPTYIDDEIIQPAIFIETDFDKVEKNEVIQRPSYAFAG